MANSKDALSKTAYQQLLKELIDTIEAARIKAARQLGRSVVELYFSIGKQIVIKQEEHGWGKSVVEQLSKDIQRVTGTNESFSTRNLWYMRQFHTEYYSDIELYNLTLQVPWGQNILLLSKTNHREERKFYLEKIVEAAWSRKVLLNQLKAGAYQAFHTSPKTHNFPKALPDHLAEQAEQMLKSEYSLEFLQINEPILERQLETKLVNHIKDFILELGYGFSFIGNQYRIKTKEKDYYVDLLFFHRKLKCLVAIDLKIGEFEPEFAGKMNFYLNLLNAQMKLPEENPSIGIILCAERDNIVVEYALSGLKNPIGVADYLIKKRLPASLKGELPGVSELKQLVLEEFKKS
jgi:predicted nuclease of restriction endonuclease-like (RecB) superfamily